MSIWVQLITGALSFQGVLYKLKTEDQVLTDVLKMEIFVQFVELMFYIMYLRYLATTVVGMAAVRYYDWFITTPTMLLTTIVYMKYEEYIEKKGTHAAIPVVTFGEFFKHHRSNILKILTANFLMLLCGYMGERGLLDKWTANIVGFVFFAYAFATIHWEYAVHSDVGRKLYMFLVVVWSMYGVAFLMPDVTKNNTFNALDIVAKNFFGLYLYWKVKGIALTTDKNDAH